tara:strand:+ start:694 stop:1329 length:636 start_codon:yes stop_codon:yes gene_type:complete
MTKRDATELFSEWALRDRDLGMESGHATSVGEMLSMALSRMEGTFSAIDVGCGNGWVCRALEDNEDCEVAIGVDGSEEMIRKARKRGDGEFHHARLPGWAPSQRFDLVHSMEFLYYLDDPLAMLAEIQEHWMEPGGVLVAGVDHYLENEDSLDWPVGLSVHMTTLSEEEWRQGMIEAGFVDVETRRVGVKEGFVGTLAMFGRKPATPQPPL